MTQSAMQHQVAKALHRHRNLAPTLQAVAGELAPSRRAPWLEMAELLRSGNTAAACRAAVRHPPIWLPLITSFDADDCLDRLFLVAATPPRRPVIGWGSTLYALLVTAGLLIVLSLLARSVLPIFRELLESFGIELPAVTQLILGIGAILGDGRIFLVLLAATVAAVGTMLLVRSGRGERRELLTASLGQLLAAGLTPAEAFPLARTLAGMANCAAAAEPADHRLPLSPANTGACSADPAAAPVLLGVLAENYADRGMQRQHLAEWLLGPVAVVLMGFAVGLTTLVLFLPLVRLVGALS